MAQSKKLILIASVIVIIIVGFGFAAQPANAQLTWSPHATCLNATGQGKGQVEPPKLYFLPFCDQTPAWRVDINTGETDSTCEKGSKCIEYDEYCMPVRTCQPDDFVQLFASMAQKGIIALPVIALVFIIWAGFNFIMSGGNPEKIKQAQKMMVSVLLGVVITVVLAWFWTTFVVSIITGDAKIFGRPWWGDDAGVNNPVETIGPSAGCCVTPQGCLNGITERECDDYETLGTYCVTVPLVGTNICNTSWIQSTECSTYSDCNTLQNGCCVPLDDTSNDCVIPDPIRGCGDITTTHYLVEGTSCSGLSQCQ